MQEGCISGLISSIYDIIINHYDVINNVLFRFDYLQNKIEISHSNCCETGTQIHEKEGLKTN